MGKEGVIINRVANSPLITINLEDFIINGERSAIDIKEFLYEGLILKEKDFRESLKNHDWTIYKDKLVAVHCSADAIIPVWAYMLITSRLQFFARYINFGTPEDLEIALFMQALSSFNPEEYQDKKIVIKGCNRQQVPDSAYVELTRLLTPYASSIMYGEACSTVPIYKRNKIRN